MYKLIFVSDIDLMYFNLYNIIEIIFSVFIFFILWKSYKSKKTKKFLVFLMILFIVFHLFSIVNFYITKNKIVKALKNNTYSITEGYIKNFHAMPKGGHDVEKFDVNRTHFELLYSGNYPGAKTLFYTLTKNRNGPIQGNGDKVKIYYISDNGENKIIKMWIQKN